MMPFRLLSLLLGFDVEQQNEIVNTETKKIIHTLEDEQKVAAQELTPKSTGKVTPLTAPINEKTSSQTAVIRHQLFDEDAKSDFNTEVSNATSDMIKNIEVVDHEVVPATDSTFDNDFVIINAQDIIKEIEIKDEEELTANNTVANSENQDQFTLAFDMPVFDSQDISEEIKSEFLDTSDKKEKEVEIKNSTSESKTVEQVKDTSVKRYSLEDYMEEEKRLTGSHVNSIPDEPVLSKQNTLTSQNSVDSDETIKDPDPLNHPISDALKARAAERRAKMKDFNYKFRNNNASIDDIEKEPAYKRAGIDVDHTPENNSLSRLSLGTDSNDDLQIRRNNSFLHDNVD